MRHAAAAVLLILGLLAIAHQAGLTPYLNLPIEIMRGAGVD
jgi:hypothetical protein